MSTFLENEEEIKVEQFNGSFRKALKMKNSDTENDSKTEIKGSKEHRKTSPQKKKEPIIRQMSNDVVRISISKTIDKKVREKILSHYMKTEELMSIKQFVENSIIFYLDKNKD